MDTSKMPHADMANWLHARLVPMVEKAIEAEVTVGQSNRLWNLCHEWAEDAAKKGAALVEKFRKNDLLISSPGNPKPHLPGWASGSQMDKP